MPTKIFSPSLFQLLWSLHISFHLFFSLQGEHHFPFDKVIKANLGDAQALGNPPLTYLRQVLALAVYPPLLQSPSFPSDAKVRAEQLLSGCGGRSVGAYSASYGMDNVRRDVAKFLERRDGGVKADWQCVLLSAGATESIRVRGLFRGKGHLHFPHFCLECAFVRVDSPDSFYKLTCS